MTKMLHQRNPFAERLSSLNFKNGRFGVVLFECYCILSFIFIPWILTGLQNPYGYGNSHIWLRSQEVKSV